MQYKILKQLTNVVLVALLAGCVGGSGENLDTTTHPNSQPKILSQSVPTTFAVINTTIKNSYSNKVVDVTNGDFSNGTQIQQYEPNGSNAQKWDITPISGKTDGGQQLFKISINGKNLALDNYYSSTEVKLTSVFNPDILEHQWKVYDNGDDTYSFQNMGKDKKFLDLYSCNSNNGIKLKLNYPDYSSCDKPYGGSIRWKLSNNLTPVKSDFQVTNVIIINSYSNKVADVTNGNFSNGTQIQQYEPNGSNAQRWDITPISGKTDGGQQLFKISINGKNFALDNYYSSTEIKLTSVFNPDILEHQWKVYENGDGTYSFQNMGKDKKFLDLYSCNSNNGVKLKLNYLDSSSCNKPYGGSIRWRIRINRGLFAVVADPQLGWTHCDENGSTSACQEEKEFFSIPNNYSQQDKLWISQVYNLGVMKAILNIQSLITDKFSGLIINGDLTEFGAQGNDFNTYLGIYHNSNITVYPGLGNHDYKNNVNDCFNNDCAAVMVQYLRDYVRSSIANNNLDYSEDYWIFNGRIQGSLAYSWDSDKYHFVQLNWGPNYETEFWNYNYVTVSNDQWKITKAYDWLKSDLDKAKASNKRIVINLHHLSQFPEINSYLEQYNIVAIFEGHLHSLSGLDKFISTSNNRKVPVFYSGAPLYGKFLLSSFEDDEIKVWKVNVGKDNSSGSSSLSGRITVTTGSGNDMPISQDNVDSLLCIDPSQTCEATYRVKL